MHTLIVPNQAIAIYVTQWKYDSHNRLLEMTYPDGERINYEYDLGGQLSKVVGEHFHRYDYVRRLGYDKFGQRIYMQYCNGTETFYGYDARNRRMGSKKGGMKVHTLMKYHVGVPMVVQLTSAAKHDHYLLKEVHLPQDATLAIDRAYIDIAQFQRLTEEVVCYVTR